MNRRKLIAFLGARRLFCSAAVPEPLPNSSCAPWSAYVTPTRPELDFDFFLDANNTAFIERNIRCRKGIGNLQRVRTLWTRLQNFAPFTPSTAGGIKMAATTDNADELRRLWDQLYAEAALLPNITDPEAPIGDASAARCVALFGPETMPHRSADATWTTHPAEELVSGWHSLRYPRAGSGGRSYSLIGPLADIEHALLDYSFDFLCERLQTDEKGIANVEVVDVDDILPISTTRACGVQQQPANEATPIQYRVFRANQLRFDADPGMANIQNNGDDDAIVHQSSAELRANSYGGFCLSGTAEMGIAHRLKGRVFDEHELPTYFIAQSRCFRPELASNQQDSGLYRVHEFNKIELFVVCTENQSVAELQRIVRLQQSLFASLQLRCQVLDMPSEELSAPASRKFDLEAWMPGRNCWGELSSASNCTDFQARRLHLKYRPSGDADDRLQGPLRFVHTCNGTGLASTRAMVALLETHQTGHRKGVKLPEVIIRRMPSERSVGIWYNTPKSGSRKFSSFD